MSFVTFGTRTSGRIDYLGFGSAKACLLVLLAALPAFSQANLGRLLGTVRDSTGAVVVGAVVTIIDVDRGLERSVVTDEAGQFAAPGISPGRKTVRAEFKGFKIFEQTNIQLEVGQDARLDFTLQPGEVSETVRVMDSPPLLDTTSAELGGTISNQIINDLPLNGRNYQNLLTLRPGVTIYAGGGGWTQSTNGLRAHDNVYMVDGLVNNEPWTGQSVYNAAAAAGDAGTILSIDAIQEFRTEQNPRAEFGWKPGSIVNVGIKSGTNAIHGTAYAYGRTDSWDAKDYFTPPPTDSVCRINPAACNPPLGLEQFGGTVGGPIRRDKLFYFLNFEDQRYTVGSPFVANAPVACAGGAAGCGLTATNPSLSLIDACNAVPAGSRSALSLRLAGLNPDCSPSSSFPNLFPNNSGTAAGDPALFSPGLSNTNQIDTGLTKLDYHISAKHVINGVYFISQGNGVFNDAAGEVRPAWETNQYMRAQVGSGNWTWIPNSRWVNLFKAGYSHYYQTFLSGDSSVNPTTYGLNTGVTNPLYYGMPAITFSSFAPGTFQLGASWPKIVGPDGVLQIVNHTSVQFGNHAIKFGGEAMQNSFNGDITANAKGPIRFRSLQDFFSGSPLRGTILIGDAARALTSWGYAAFIQDDWRISPRVTINLGLRYELNTVFKEAHDLIGNFDANQGLVQVGKQISSPFNGDHNNFSPRLGFAWDVGGNGRTVLRAGAGLIYEQLSYDVFMGIGNLLGIRTVPTGASLVVNGKTTPGSGSINLGVITVPGSSLNWNGSSVGGQTIYSLSTLSLQCGDGLGSDPSPCATVGVDRNLRTPYVSTWTVSLQRAVTNNFSVDVAYVGNHGTKLVQLVDLNQAPLGSGYDPAEIAYCNSHLAAASSPFACDPSDSDPGLVQAARPFTRNAKFPYLSNIYNLANLASSNYNGLQIAATQRVSGGLSFTGGYTWSHALDYACDNWGCGQGVPLNSNNPRQLYGSSDWDVRHRFTLSLTYAIPGKKSPGQILEGWSINSIVTLQTGQPWYPQDFTDDFSGTNVVSATAGHGEQWNFVGSPSDFQSRQNPIPCASGSGPSAIGGCTAPAIPQACISAATAMGTGALNSLYNVGCYFRGNSALIPPAIGSYGNLGRGTFRDSGFRNWDLSVSKSWKIRESLHAQFRAEFFNILNHPNFANPEGGPNGYLNNDPSAGFGMGCGCITPDVAGSNPVLGSGGARAMQLGLKLLF
ncbi:MAG: TonB-dependent receptor [Acidobacteriia bacterium]|nr:TonB-dependent receptor [Terriglobia bacterium]